MNSAPATVAALAAPRAAHRRLSLPLSAAKTPIAVEWFDPRTGDKQAGVRVDGGAKRTLRAPFQGDAVLYLRSK